VAEKERGERKNENYCACLFYKESQKKREKREESKTEK
jgi:hypothetical protein